MEYIQHGRTGASQMGGTSRSATSRRESGVALEPLTASGESWRITPTELRYLPITPLANGTPPSPPGGGLWMPESEVAHLRLELTYIRAEVEEVRAMLKSLGATSPSEPGDTPP